MINYKEIFLNFNSFFRFYYPNPTPSQQSFIDFIDLEKEQPLLNMNQNKPGIGSSTILTLYCLWLMLKNTDVIIMTVCKNNNQLDSMRSSFLEHFNKLDLLKNMLHYQTSERVIFKNGSGLLFITESGNVQIKILGTQYNYLIIDDCKLNQDDFENLLIRVYSKRGMCVRNISK